MDEPKVNIPLKDYNSLRDAASLNTLFIEKIAYFETRLCDMDKRISDLTYVTRNMESNIENKQRLIKPGE